MPLKKYPSSFPRLHAAHSASAGRRSNGYFRASEDVSIIMPQTGLLKNSPVLILLCSTKGPPKPVKASECIPLEFISGFLFLLSVLNPPNPWSKMPSWKPLAPALFPSNRPDTSPAPRQPCVSNFSNDKFSIFPPSILDRCPSFSSIDIASPPPTN